MKTNNFDLFLVLFPKLINVIADAKFRQINIEVIDKLMEAIKTHTDNDLKYLCIQALICIAKTASGSIIEKVVSLLVNLKDSQTQWFVAEQLK